MRGRFSVGAGSGVRRCPSGGDPCGRPRLTLRGHGRPRNTRMTAACDTPPNTLAAIEMTEELPMPVRLFVSTICRKKYDAVATHHSASMDATAEAAIKQFPRHTVAAPRHDGKRQGRLIHQGVFGRRGSGPAGCKGSLGSRAAAAVGEMPGRPRPVPGRPSINPLLHNKCES
jgi:hypothetical protein